MLLRYLWLLQTLIYSEKSLFSNQSFFSQAKSKAHSSLQLKSTRRSSTWPRRTVATSCTTTDSCTTATCPQAAKHIGDARKTVVLSALPVSWAPQTAWPSPSRITTIHQSSWRKTKFTAEKIPTSITMNSIIKNKLKCQSINLCRNIRIALTIFFEIGKLRDSIKF